MRRFAQAWRRDGALIRALFLPFCLALAGALPARAEILSYSLPEARTLALRAAVSGRPDVALSLARELLAQDRQDAAAHLAAGTARLSMGDWRAAYRDGRRAFRHADTPDARYSAARVAALAALGEDRTMLAQFWLRRAGDVATDPADRARVERQFLVLKAKSPWRYRFDFSATPSSNVNGGADSAYNIIDGVPLVGYLSADAQALSGVVAQGNLRLSYRLSAGKRHVTQARATIYHKAVTLSDEAKAKAPTVRGSDFSATSVGIGLTHAIALTRPGTLLSVSGDFRSYWQGSGRSFDAVSGKLAYARPLTERLRLSGSVGHEARRYDGGGSGRVNTAALGLSYAFANGNRLSGALQVTGLHDPNPVFDSRAVQGSISFALGRPVRSVELSTSIGYGMSDYPNYALGFIPVPGGRQDEVAYVDIDATFGAIEYAGFSPSLKLRRQRTHSNVSRFTTSEWAVSLGLQSNF